MTGTHLPIVAQRSFPHLTSTRSNSFRILPGASGRGVIPDANISRIKKNIPWLRPKSADKSRHPVKHGLHSGFASSSVRRKASLDFDQRTPTNSQGSVAHDLHSKFVSSSLSRSMASTGTVRRGHSIKPRGTSLRSGLSPVASCLRSDVSAPKPIVRTRLRRYTFAHGSRISGSFPRECDAA